MPKKPYFFLLGMNSGQDSRRAGPAAIFGVDFILGHEEGLPPFLFTNSKGASSETRIERRVAPMALVGQKGHFFGQKWP